MVIRKMAVIFTGFIFIVTLNGCAGLSRKESLETQKLKNQVMVLETETQSKNEEITRLKSALDEFSGQKEAAKTVTAKKKNTEVKSRPKAKDIQIALKNAGYNPGVIDGRMGKQTRDAIKAFQKQNNLPADGRAGKQTWELLKGYLDKKVK